MKSKKAKEFIDGCLNHLAIEMSDHAKWQLRASMSHTAELAEQEAKERMRDKAIEEFCKDCPIYSIQTSNGVQTSNGGNCPDCSVLNAFKQRLNEE
jgi:hypothetical protein